MFPYVGLLASLAVALGGPADAGPAATQAHEPISVVSVGQEIDFPKEIVLTLAAEGDAEISEVVLFYGRGSQRSVRVYGYPSFTPSNSVEARFTIDTDGSEFMPSGVDIEYYYVIRDSQDRTLQTQTYDLEYLDPAYRWQRLVADDFTLVWHDRSRDQVESAAAEVALRLKPLKAMLDVDEAGNFKAVILNDTSEADRAFPTVSGAATRGHVYGGFAFADSGVFLLVGMGPGGMTHEMTHLYLDAALDSPFAVVPAWLNEGLAMYYESAPEGRSSRVPPLDNPMPLGSMGAIPGRPEDVRAFYSQARSVVAFMMDTWGPEPMSELLRSINQGHSVDVAIEEAYEIGLEELESRWRDGAAERTTQALVPDIGSVVTSFLIAGAAAVAAMGVLWRWWFRRRSPETDEDVS